MSAAGAQALDPLDVANLRPVMLQTSGAAEVKIGLIDGPVAVDHPALEAASIRLVGDALRGSAASALAHGTFMAGVLAACRGGLAPALCPGCTLLVRPIFVGSGASDSELPTATSDALAVAIVDCLREGARVLNLSLAPAQLALARHRALEAALDAATQAGAIVIAAAGNQAMLGASPITRHPAVIPVVARARSGGPAQTSVLGATIAKRGLLAPGEGITSLGPGGGMLTLSGSSAATPFVTGAVALLWSLRPTVGPDAIRYALRATAQPWRRSVVPPLLDAGAAAAALAGWREPERGCECQPPMAAGTRRVASR